METDRLRAFCTIVDAGSLTRAAEILNVSHSGLSKAIATLQNELGFKVFRPAGRGLELTPEGKNVYNQSRRILEMVGDLQQLRPSPRGNALRIGLPEVLALVLAAPLTHAFDPFILEELDTGEIEKLLLEGRIDFGFSFVPFPQPDLEHLKVMNLGFRSFVKRGAFAGVDPAQIPYVTPSSELKDNPLSLKIRDGWRSELPRKIAFRTNALSLALEIAASGRAAIYIPAVVAQAFNRDRVPSAHLIDVAPSGKRRAAELTTRDVFLVKRRADAESPEMKKALRILRQQTRENPLP